MQIAILPGSGMVLGLYRFLIFAPLLTLYGLISAKSKMQLLPVFIYLDHFWWLLLWVSILPFLGQCFCWIWLFGILAAPCVLMCVGEGWGGLCLILVKWCDSLCLLKSTPYVLEESQWIYLFIVKCVWLARVEPHWRHCVVVLEQDTFILA